MLSDAESLSVLKRCTHGVLALSDQEGFPYSVPMSYVYFNNAIYFHCAMIGHKIDLIAANPHASFCVVDQDIIMPETFTTHFRSVIAFGNISCITDRIEKERILYILGEKYAPGREESLKKEIDGSIMRTNILRLQIHHMTGKEAIELTRNRTLHSH